MKDKITKKEGLKDKLLKGLDLAYERMIAEISKTVWDYYFQNK